MRDAAGMEGAGHVGMLQQPRRRRGRLDAPRPARARQMAAVQRGQQRVFVVDAAARVDRNSAPGFMRAKAHASIRPRVASSSGQCRLRMSARVSRVSKSTGSAPRARISSAVSSGSQAMTVRPKPCAIRATRRPISPMPTRPMARPSISRPISASRLRAVPARRAAPDSFRRLTSDSSSAWVISATEAALAPAWLTTATPACVQAATSIVS